MQPAAAAIAQRQIRTIRVAADALNATGPTGLRLAELLAEIARAWQSASEQPHSIREDLRWTPVCVKAARIAEEMNR